ncbi:MAG: SHOCT domain-containing protein, partial [Comamonadaceae bacterium]
HQGGRSAICFTSQDGLIDLDTLARVTPQAPPDRGNAAGAPAADRQSTNSLPAATEVAARERPSAALATDGPPQPLATKPSVETLREPSAPAPAAPAERRPTAVAAVTHDQVLETLVRLGDLHKSGVLDAEEFRRKKTELLDRL